MNHKVMARTQKGDFWIGTVVQNDRGYRFLSRTSAIGDSRKYWDLPKDSVPKKIKHWYFA